jgi:hypothetical protein
MQPYVKSLRVAMLLAVMLKRSGKTRARVSEKTIRILARRQVLRESFISEVKGDLEELDVIAVRLARGGFGLVAISALEGAPSLTAKESFPEHRATNDDFLWQELNLESVGDEE